MDTTEDGCGHLFALAWAKDTVRADSAGEAQDSAWIDHEEPPSVPLVPMLFGGS